MRDQAEDVSSGQMVKGLICLLKEIELNLIGNTEKLLMRLMLYCVWHWKHKDKYDFQCQTQLMLKMFVEYNLPSGVEKDCRQTNMGV